MVYLRKTIQIADAAQGNALKKIGFTQDTIVRPGRDSSDDGSLTKALTEAHGLMSQKLTDLKAMTQTA
jgi:hypothetical protein